MSLKLNIGPSDILASPTIEEPDGEPIPRLWDLEGESDFIAGLEAGLVHVLTTTTGAKCLRGHERHRERLQRLPIREVCVVRDLDKAGEEGAKKAARWWSELGVSARIVRLPGEMGSKRDLRNFCSTPVPLRRPPHV